MHVLFYLIISLFLSVGIGGGTATYAMDYVPSGLNEEIAHVNALIQELDAHIETARHGGIDVTREYMTRDMARHYVRFAVSDHMNQRQVADMYQAFIDSRWYPQYISGGGQPVDATKHAEDTPLRMIEQTKAFLYDAIQELTTVIHENLNRPPVPDIDTDSIYFGNGHLKQEGRPVFLSGFNVNRPFMQYQEQIFPETLVSLFLWIGALTEEGRIPDTKIKAIQDTLNTYRTQNVQVDLLLDRELPQWAYDRYPDLKLAHSTIDFDIDHPKARALLKAYLSQILPVLQPYQDVILSFNLQNEPAWASSAFSVQYAGDVSPYTYAKYRSYLREKYQQITALNDRWDTDYTSFDDIHERAMNILLAGTIGAVVP